MIWHWFTADYWPPSWPNIFSPNVWTIAGILLHLIVTMVHRERLHRDMKQHVTKTLKGGGDDGTACVAGDDR